MEQLAFHARSAWHLSRLLVDDVETDLQRPRIAGRFAGDLAELSGGGVQVRSAPVGMIEEVIRISSKFGTCSFRNPEFLLEREILILITRLVDGISNPLLMSESAFRGSCKDGGAIGVVGGEIHAWGSVQPTGVG